MVFVMLCRRLSRIPQRRAQCTHPLWRSRRRRAKTKSGSSCQPVRPSRAIAKSTESSVPIWEINWLLAAQELSPVGVGSLLTLVVGLFTIAVPMLCNEGMSAKDAEGHHLKNEHSSDTLRALNWHGQRFVEARTPSAVSGNECRSAKEALKVVDFIQNMPEMLGCLVGGSADTWLRSEDELHTRLCGIHRGRQYGKHPCITTLFCLKGAVSSRNGFGRRCSFIKQLVRQRQGHNEVGVDAFECRLMERLF